MAHKIDIGVDGILRDSRPVIEAAETTRDIEMTRLEKEFIFKQAVVKFGFAWKVLQQDVAASANRYISSSKYHSVEITKGELETGTGLTLSTDIKDRQLKRISIGTSSNWGGADIQVRAFGPTIDEMDTHYYEFDDMDGELSDTKHAQYIDPVKDTMDVNYFVHRVNALHDYLYLPDYKRQPVV